MSTSSLSRLSAVSPEQQSALLVPVPSTDPGREGKTRFWQEFKGIGKKYSRNIMMDVYHPDFRDSIAIDERIKGISKALGLRFPNYEGEETFYLEVAAKAGLNGWELDRLLYGFKNEVIERLHRQPRRVRIRGNSTGTGR